MTATIINALETAIIAYFLILTLSYTALTVMAFIDLVSYRRRLWRGSLHSLLNDPSYRPISILVPAFNERDTLPATVRSLLSLRYPEYEVIVINDGSTDDTLGVVRTAFAMQPTPAAIRRSLETNAVRGLYRSLDHPNLILVDKDNGGKSDALNAGINVASFPIFCCMDADSILEPDALLRVARVFSEDERIVAAGGIVRTLNGSQVKDGRVTHIRAPNRLLTLVQAVEYARGFLTGRAPLARLNSLMIISGTFGLFRKDAVVEAGGYHRGTVCEDMEIVVRLHRRARERKREDEKKVPEQRAGRVVFIPDPVCWTQVPSDWRSLLRQRDRWQRGLLESLWIHRRMFCNPFYGRVGLIGMPFYVLFEALGPVIELAGYVMVVALLLMGRLELMMALLFFLLAVSSGIVLSVMALILDDLLFRRYERERDVLKMILAAFLEFFGYRQVLAVQRTIAFFNLVFRRGHWGKARRSRIAHSETSVEPA
jgi:cellulose synthase/poly-beta-1,6-N-acetylglucosamine synthase-like glycosyltransferase